MTEPTPDADGPVLDPTGDAAVLDPTSGTAADATQAEPPPADPAPEATAVPDPTPASVIDPLTDPAPASSADDPTPLADPDPVPSTDATEAAADPATTVVDAPAVVVPPADPAPETAPADSDTPVEDPAPAPVDDFNPSPVEAAAIDGAGVPADADATSPAPEPTAEDWTDPVTTSTTAADTPGIITQDPATDPSAQGVTVDTSGLPPTPNPITGPDETDPQVVGDATVNTPADDPGVDTTPPQIDPTVTGPVVVQDDPTDEVPNPPKQVIDAETGDNVADPTGIADTGPSGGTVIDTSVPYVSDDPEPEPVDEDIPVADTSSPVGGTDFTVPTSTDAPPETDSASEVPVVEVPGLNTILTDSSTVTVSGTADHEADTQVAVYLDAVLLATLPIDSTGNWTTTLEVGNGNHSVYVVALKEDGSDDVQSATVPFQVAADVPTTTGAASADPDTRFANWLLVNILGPKSYPGRWETITELRMEASLWIENLMGNGETQSSPAPEETPEG